MRRQVNLSPCTSSDRSLHRAPDQTLHGSSAAIPVQEPLAGGLATTANTENYREGNTEKHPKTTPPREPSESQNGIIQPGLIVIYFSC